MSEPKSGAYQKGRNDERETWINQKANQHDQRIREAFKQELIQNIKKNTLANKYRDGETAFDITRDIESR